MATGRTVIAIGLGAGLLWSVPAVALDYSALFTAKGRSVYSNGPAVAVDSGTQRVGPDAQDLGKSFGRVYDPCKHTPLPNCSTGAEAGADIHFNFGLNYGLKVNSGSFDLQYPVNVHIDQPADETNLPGNPFTIRSSFTIPGYTALAVHYGIGVPAVTAKFQVHSPTLEAFVDADAKLNAFIGARACVIGVCEGPSVGRFDVDGSRTLVALNRNGDGKVVIGDVERGLNQYFTALDGNLTARLNIPNIDAVSSNGGGSTATQLKTFGRGNVAAVGINLGGLVGDLLPVPLTGNIGGIGYNLASVSGGVSLDLRQTLNLTLTPIQTYNFLRPVRQQFGDGSLGGFTNSISVPLGQDLTLRSGTRNVGVVPVTSLVATLSNLTELVIGGDVNVQALAAHVFGFDIGPLYDSGSVSGDLFAIPLFRNSFDTSFGSITGLPFNIRQSFPLILADAGPIASIAVTGEDPAHPGIFNTAILQRETECFFRICSPTFYADGSPVTFERTGKLSFLSASDALTLPGVDPGHVGTDAEQIAALAATGFSTTVVPLTAPPGAPRPPGATVPEPETWVLLIVGFGAVGAVLRRQSRRTRPV